MNVNFVIVKEPEGKSYKEQLRTSDLSAVGKRRLRGDSIALYSFLRRASGVGGAEIFYLESSDRMHGYGSKHIRGGLDWTFGSISLPKSWSNTETGFLERWSMP